MPDKEAIFEIGDYVYHVNTGFDYIGYVDHIEYRWGNYWYHVCWDRNDTPASMNIWWREQELEYS